MSHDISPVVEETVADTGAATQRSGKLAVMAKNREEKAQAKAKAKAAKQPGRLAQIVQVFTMTRKGDPASLWMMLGAALGPIVAGVVIGIVISGGFWLSIVLWGIIGVLSGLLLFLVVLGRRAEKVAYSQIEGKPGAVGAVIKSSLARGWIGQEMPVNVSPRTQDAVYRVVGRTGVTLIAEGPKSRTKHMLDEERKRVSRIVPNVAVHYLYVGPDADSTPLYKIRRVLNKNKKSLRRQEITAVANRLQSLTPSLPVPKGIDPLNARPDRRSMRGR